MKCRRKLKQVILEMKKEIKNAYLDDLKKELKVLNLPKKLLKL